MTGKLKVIYALFVDLFYELCILFGCDYNIDGLNIANGLNDDENIMILPKGLGFQNQLVFEGESSESTRYILTIRYVESSNYYYF